MKGWCGAAQDNTQTGATLLWVKRKHFLQQEKEFGTGPCRARADGCGNVVSVARDLKTSQRSADVRTRPCRARADGCGNLVSAARDLKTSQL